MPELPEVETIRRSITPRLQGRRIIRVNILSPRVFRVHKNQAAILRQIKGRKITRVSRLGKNLLFELDSGKILSLHLMMTGKILLNPKEKSKYDRAVFFLSGGVIMVFNDIRSFGKCELMASPNAALGKDALAVSRDEFILAYQGRSGRIRNLLLNQCLVAGVGNIYANEILWYAGIRPSRRANALSRSKLARLYIAMHLVFKKALKAKGSSMRDYKMPDGKSGGYFAQRKGYARAGERCSRDKGIIRRVTLNQRSAYFCPIHQK